MTNRIFVPHLINGQVFISEKIIAATGAISFSAVLRLDKGKVVQSFGPPLTRADGARCQALVKQMLALDEAMQQAGPFDAMQLARMAAATSHLVPGLLRLINEYNAAVLVYALMVQDYLARPAKDRFSAELSLDLYRLALGFHDLDNARRLIDEDLDEINKKSLSRHHIECIFDLFYHIALRLGDRPRAYDFLSRAWTARPDYDRSLILITEAAFFRKSQDVVKFAQHLQQTAALAPMQLAQLAVAQARLGYPEAARQTYETLSAQETSAASSLARKIAAFLKIVPA